MKIRSAFLTILFLLFVSPLMAAVVVSYTPGTNTMDVTGGTEGTPALIIDLLQFDFDTAYTLLDAAVIDNDPDEMSLDNPVRAKDSRGLRLLISADVDRAGATVDIVGRDADGDSVTESGIDIATALTTAVETESKYSQIYTVTFNGMTNGDEVTITQPRLGVIAAGLEPDSIQNGGFDAWTADDPDDWIVSGESGSDPMVTEVSGKCRMFTSDNTYVQIRQDNIFNSVSAYRFSIEIAIAVSGGIKFIDPASQTIGSPFNNTGTRVIYANISSIGFFAIGRNFTNDVTDITFDNVTVQKLTGQYSIGCNIEFGDGSTPSYFTSDEHVSFDNGFLPSVLSQATLSIGEHWEWDGSDTSPYSIEDGGELIIFSNDKWPYRGMKRVGY